MPRRKVGLVAASSIALALIFATAGHAAAQDAKATYPSMAPLGQYLMEDRNSEIALARSAAPESIARDAEVEARAAGSTEREEDREAESPSKESVDCHGRAPFEANLGPPSPPFSGTWMKPEK